MKPIDLSRSCRIAMLVACLLMVLWGGLGGSSATGAEAAPKRAANTRIKGPPVGKPITVKFDADAALFSQATHLEKTQQLRDWLLWLAASESIPAVQELNETLFDAPIVRHDFTKAITRFEYGTTRSCVLADRSVIALVPKADPDQRADDLAYIADEHRKNLGRKPTIVRVFEYQIDDSDLTSATLTRLADIPATELYSPKYGYIEAVISDLKSLDALMASTDDLVYAKLDNGKLRLGGRNLRTGYQNIRPTEVATLWQAGKQSDLANSLSYFIARANDKEGVSAAKRYRDAFRSLGGAGLGFSLDPTYDYVRLVERLSKGTLREMVGGITNPLSRFVLRLSLTDEWGSLTMAKAIESAGVQGERFEYALTALKRADITPLRRLVAELDGGGVLKLGTFVQALIGEVEMSRPTYSGSLSSHPIGVALSMGGAFYVVEWAAVNCRDR